jgi:hypothetical protein
MSRQSCDCEIFGELNEFWQEFRTPPNVDQLQVENLFSAGSQGNQDGVAAGHHAADRDLVCGRYSRARWCSRPARFYAQATLASELIARAVLPEVRRASPVEHTIRQDRDRE